MKSKCLSLIGAVVAVTFFAAVPAHAGRTSPAPAPVPACSAGEYQAYTTLSLEYGKMSLELAYLTADLTQAYQEIYTQVVTKTPDPDAIVEIADMLLDDADSLACQSEASLSAVEGIPVGSGQIDESMILKAITDSTAAYEDTLALSEWVVDFSDALIESDTDALIELVKEADELVDDAQEVSAEYTAIATDLATSTCIPSK